MRCDNDVSIYNNCLCTAVNKHARKYDEANEGYLRVLSRGQQEDLSMIIASI